jgi:hypothetical protein
MKLKNWQISLIIGTIYTAIFVLLISVTISWGVDPETALYLLLPGSFGLLLALFIVQTTTRERDVPFLIISVLFGTLSGIFAALRIADVFPSIPSQRAFFLSLHMSCAGLQFLFFFLFIEGLREYRPSSWRLLLAFGLSLLQLVSLWYIYWFQGQDAVNDIWLFADIGYDTLGLFTFLGCALPLYIQTYRLTKEGRSIVLAIAVILIGAGFVLGSLGDYTDYFGQVFSEIPASFKDVVNDITGFNDALDLSGLLLFIIVYVTNVDYLYRLPNDNYALMVSLKTGETIHFVRFKTRSKVDLNQDLLSGLLSTINSVFQAIMTTSASIKEISSKNATLLTESGQWVSATIITEKPSAILDKALKRYVNHFERMFSVRLGDKSTCVTDYDAAKTLLKKIFPFFVVDDTPSPVAR